MSDVALEPLFERFRSRGDLRALAQIFDLIAPELLPLALHLSGRRHDAEDLVQQTFLAALEKASDYDATRPLRPWMVGILVLEARRLHRAGARSIEPERLREPRPDQPHERAVEAELRHTVEAALQDLPEHYARIVSLHLFDGLAPRELAERLGIDAALARTQLARGLERLRRSLPPSGSTAWIAVELGAVLVALRAGLLKRAAARPVASAARAGALKTAIGIAAGLCAIATATVVTLTLACRSSGPGHPEHVALAGIDTPQAGASGVATELDRTAESGAGHRIAIERGITVLAFEADGHSPFAGAEVELTAGNVAGHAMASGTRYERGLTIPPRTTAARTDERGRVHFEQQSAGTWAVRVCWSPWLSSTTTVELGEDRGASCSLTLPEHGFVEGTLLLPDGVPHDEPILVLLLARKAPQDPVFEQRIPPEKLAGRSGFRLGPLATGRAEFILMRSSEEGSGESRKPVTLSRFTIEVGATTHADIDLRRQCTAHLELELRVDGQVLPGLHATVLLDDMPDHGCTDSAWESSAGRIRLPLAPERPQRVVIRGADWLWCMPEGLKPAQCETLRRSFDIPIAKGSFVALDARTRLPLREEMLSYVIEVRSLPQAVDPQSDVLMSRAGQIRTDGEGRVALALPPCELRFARGTGVPALELRPGRMTEIRKQLPTLRWTEQGPAIETLLLPPQE